jgi:hypothetical protein
LYQPKPENSEPTELRVRHDGTSKTVRKANSLAGMPKTQPVADIGANQVAAWMSRGAAAV